MDEVPTQAPDFVVSLSGSSDSGITANLSLALTRGAGESRMSVESRCPRLESVRRGEPLQPTPAGDGLRPAGLLFRGQDLQQAALLSIETSSTATRSPFSYKEKAFGRFAWGAGAQISRAINSTLHSSLSTLSVRGRGTAPRWMR